MIKTCAVCSGEYPIKASHADGSTYCSRACMAIGYVDRLVGDLNPNWRGGQVPKTCRNCGATYTRIQALAEGSLYCSRVCQLAFQNKNARPKKQPKAPARTKECSVCLKAIRHKGPKYCSPECKSRAVTVVIRCPLCLDSFKTDKKHPSKFCSKGCSRKAQSIRQSGASSHLWQGGKTDEAARVRNHPLYKEWRQRVFSRDDFTCQCCLRTSASLEGDGKQGLTAHHIIGFADDPKLRLKVSNGVTLCWQCHRDYHRTIRKRDTEVTESNLSRAVGSFFTAETGCVMFKIHGGLMQHAGLPDYLGVVAGRAVGIELKVPPNFTTPLQKAVIRKMRGAGALVFACFSLDHVRAVVAAIKDTQFPAPRTYECESTPPDSPKSGGIAETVTSLEQVKFVLEDNQ